MDPAIPIMGYILLSIFLILLFLIISFFLVCKYQTHTETQIHAQLSPQAQGINELEARTRIPLRRGGVGRRGKGLRGVLPLRRGGVGYCEVGGRGDGKGDGDGDVVGGVDGGERINSIDERNGYDEVDVVDGEVETHGAPPPYTGRGEV